MNQHFTIRLIEAGDNAQVASIIRQVMTEFDCVGEGYSINDAEVDSMYENYPTEISRFYVLTRGTEVFGCGGFAPLKGGDEGTCELKKMYFLEEARGKGMGRKLLESCLEAAKSLGYHKMYLETVERMTDANVLYQKMGFKKLCGTLGNTGHGTCDTFYARDL